MQRIGRVSTKYQYSSTIMISQAATVMANQSRSF